MQIGKWVGEYRDGAIDVDFDGSSFGIEVLDDPDAGDGQIVILSKEDAMMLFISGLLAIINVDHENRHKIADKLGLSVPDEGES